MANRYANLVGSNKIKDEWTKINAGFDAVQADMDAKADADDLVSLENTVNDHIGAGGAAHAEATTLSAGFMAAADKQKLDGIEEGAQVNQNAFAKVNDVEANDPSDELTITGGTGITVTTNPNTKEVIVTATGEATPGPHGSSHTEHGADPIPTATTTEGGLMSADHVLMLESHATRHSADGDDPLTPEMIGAASYSHVMETAFDDVHGLLSGGRIIEETGSNANGRYVKFSNGIAIQYGYKNLQGLQAGGDGNLNITLPLALVTNGIDSITCTLGVGSYERLSTAPKIVNVLRLAAGTGFTVFFDQSNHTFAANRNLSFQVIGRWK